MKSLLKILSACAAIAVTFNSYAEENPYTTHRQSAVMAQTGAPWSAEYQVKLIEKMDEAKSLLANAKSFNYPISEEDLQKLYSGDTIPFFAYSSMIDKTAGALRAISEKGANTQELAIAFGIQRTFNRQVPDETVASGWGALARPNDLAILNIFEKEDSLLNGVIFQLTPADLHILTKREIGYHLIPVLVMRWDDAINEKEPGLTIAYTFLAPDVTIEIKNYTSSHVNPIPGYFNYLQTGLNQQGNAFKAMWWATTYLADKTTPVTELPYQNVDLKVSN